MIEIDCVAGQAEVEAVAGPYFRADPIGSNVGLTSLTGLLRRGETVGEQPRCWPARRDGAVVGLLLQAGDGAPALLDTAEHPIAMALADAAARTVQHLPGCNGPAGPALAFAAAWASARHQAVQVMAAQRFYALTTLVAPPPVPGRLRLATNADLELLTQWSICFQQEIFGHGPAEIDAAALAAMLSGRTDDRLAWLWETDRPLSMALATPMAGGVSRIQGVYTPAAERGRGLAAAVVAGAVAARQADGATHCVLYTDLANPTSNAVYQRLGFTPHSEHLNLTFA